MGDSRIVGGGQNNSPIIAATVRQVVPGVNALDVYAAGPSGDQYVSRSSNATPGRCNITTSPTQIFAANLNRIGLLVQNVERQQIFFGWSSALSVANPGGIMGPTVTTSGDGGALKITDYTGEVWGVLVSGDGDVFCSEFVR